MRNRTGLSRRTVVSGGAALAGAAMLPRGAAAAAPGPPNVVFIMADDLGAFDLSCYGRPDYRTPHIDSLARDGLKFGFGYASSATCTPTRVGLFSGRYPNRVPVGTVAGGGATSDTIGYSPAWPSLARMFRQGGYRTGLVGKWNLGPLPNFGPLKSGYDEFFGLSGGAIDYWSHDIASPFEQRADRSVDLYSDETPIVSEDYATDLFTDRACDFIARHSRRPFLLSLHYTAPHWPWQSRTERDRDRLLDAHFDGGSMAIYADMVRALDEGVGRVLATLKRHGLARDTIVVFTSDNGGERFSYQWPLKGEKGDLWEGGVRVPLLVRWPRRVARGAVSDQVILSMDWLPTLAALAGLVSDPAMPPDGSDLSAQLLGAPPIDRTVFWKTPRAQSALAFPWKYVKEGQHEHLVDLRRDVSENANLKRREPEIFARLQRASEQWAQTMLPSPPAGSDAAMDAVRALDGPARPAAAKP